MSTCPTCGVVYGMESNFDALRRKDGKSFYCSNGHSLSYFETDLIRAESAAKRAQALLECERRRRELFQAELDHTERRRRAEAGAKTKLRKRAAAGVCPCCTCSFENVRAHLKTKHPEFVEAVRGEKL